MAERVPRVIMMFCS